MYLLSLSVYLYILVVEDKLLRKTLLGKGGLLRDFRDQMFYREMLRLRDEQRQRLGIGGDRSTNVVSLDRYRRERQVRRPTDKPTKPAA